MVDINGIFYNNINKEKIYGTKQVTTIGARKFLFGKVGPLGNAFVDNENGAIICLL